MNIVCIGSGNVAWHLAQRLYKAGHNMEQVYSRSLSNAQYLADLIDADCITDLNLIAPNADLYLIALTDDITGQLSQSFPIHLGPSQIICHTSGVLASDTFSSVSVNYGSFYPYQTLTKNNPLSHDQLPICIHANNEKTIEILQLLASQISSQVQLISDDKKQYLHVAGVIINNFTNHLVYQAEQLLESKNISPDVMKPLLNNTINKLENMNPLAAQTGPARRNDLDTITKHMELISDPKLKEIYQSITSSILNTYHENR